MTNKLYRHGGVSMPSNKTHQGKIHMKTIMKKNLSELATVMIKTSISQLIHKINENKIKGFSH